MTEDIEAAIIEKVPDLQRFYRLAIASKGYRIAFISNNSREALERLRQLERKPDLLFFSDENDTASIDNIKREFPNVIIKTITREA